MLASQNNFCNVRTKLIVTNAKLNGCSQNYKKKTLQTELSMIIKRPKN